MKDQFVIACLADLSMNDIVVSHACFLAQMLNKGLILLYVEDPHYKGPTIAEAEPILKAIEASHPETHPAHVAMKGNTREIIDALPTLLNGVIAVAGVNPQNRRNNPTHPRQVLHNFASCKIAYLTVQEPLIKNEDYHDIANTLFILKNDVINRYTYMIKSQRCNILYILLCDKALKMLLIILVIL